MAQDSKIEWCHHTANLWHGCTEVHEGCKNCYARVLSHRWKRDLWGNDVPRMMIESVWNDLARYQKLAAAAGEMHRVFVGSMMDIFEKPMPVVNNKGTQLVGFNFPETGYVGPEKNNANLTTKHLRDKLFEFIGAGKYPNLLFLFLTKRPSNINKYIPEAWKENPPANVMFGTSPVDQKTADILIPQLLQVKGKRFLSVEPMLGSVDLQKFLFMPALNMSPVDIEPTGAIDWVICGGESGHHARPMHPDWVRYLRDQCKEAGVPFFLKQWGEYRMHSQTNMYELYENVGKSPHEFQYYNGQNEKVGVFEGDWIKCGKKAAGRLLDGKLYDEFPKL